jgi:hypothetical protein
MIFKNEKPLSSLVEKKTKHLKIEYRPIRMLYYEDKCIIKGALKLGLCLKLSGPILAPHHLDSRGPIQALHCPIKPFLLGRLRV